MRQFKIVQLLIFVACIVQGQSSESDADGKPGCRTRYEFTKLWRHANYNDLFWECTSWKQATVRSCAKQTLFHEWWQTCVPAPKWKDTPFTAPPTSANDEDDSCEPIELEPQCPVQPPSTTTTTEGTTTEESTTEEPTTTEEITTTYLETTTIDSRLCPGADESRLIPGDQHCFSPGCTNEIYESGEFFPSHMPSDYYNCTSPIRAARYRCQPPTPCFSYTFQSCVSPEMWYNSCILRS